MHTRHGARAPRQQRGGLSDTQVHFSQPTRCLPLVSLVGTRASPNQEREGCTETTNSSLYSSGARAKIRILHRDEHGLFSMLWTGVPVLPQNEASGTRWLKRLRGRHLLYPKSGSIISHARMTRQQPRTKKQPRTRTYENTWPPTVFSRYFRLNTSNDAQQGHVICGFRVYSREVNNHDYNIGGGDSGAWNQGELM